MYFMVLWLPQAIFAANKLPWKPEKTSAKPLKPSAKPDFLHFNGTPPPADSVPIDTFDFVLLALGICLVAYLFFRKEIVFWYNRLICN